MKLPPPVRRPKFAYWLYERRLSFRAAGRALKCSGEIVRLVCLPFDDEKRRVPGPDLMRDIIAYTDEEIREADFFPPRDIAA